MASTKPLMARKPACGLSASLRAAMRDDGRLARLAVKRETSIVSQGPTITRPAMTNRTPARNTPASVVELVRVRAPMSWT
jgi:hypothetical protein